MRNKLLPFLQSCLLRYFLLSSTFFIMSVSYAQVTNQWNRFTNYKLGTTASAAKAIAKDAAGNVYTTGAVIYDDRSLIYTVKYDPSGNRVFMRAYVIDDN